MFLKDQMSGMKVYKKQAAISKSPVRGTMNEEEIRMNRKILLEISAKKKMIQTNPSLPIAKPQSVAAPNY
jgi:hypothetical protein